MYRQVLRFYADGGQEIPPELQEYVQGVSPFTEADTVGQDPYAGMSDEDKRMIINQQLFKPCSCRSNTRGYFTRSRLSSRSNSCT